MSIEPGKLIIGWLLCGLFESHGLMAAESPQELDARIAVIQGPRSGSVSYLLHDHEQPNVTQAGRLSDGGIQLLWKVDGQRISYGSPTKWQDLRPGTLHQFRLVAEPNGLTHRLELVTQELVPGPQWQQLLDAARDNLQLLEKARQDVDRLTADLLQVQEDNRKLTSKPPAPPIKEVIVDSGPVMIDPITVPLVELHDRRAETEVVLPRSGNVFGTERYTVTAVCNRPFVQVTVTPSVLPAETTGEVKLKLQLDNVGSASELPVDLIFRAEGARSITAPVRIPFQSRTARVIDDPDVLLVHSWPMGARVWLTPLTTSHAARAEIGVTPVELALPPGRYRVELLPAKGGSGHWAAPEGVTESLDEGSVTTELLAVSVLKKAEERALVRGVWLPSGNAGVFDWHAAVKDARLFTLPAVKTFSDQLTLQLTSVQSAEVTERELQTWHAVLKRTGFARFPLSRERVLDVDAFRSGGALRSRLRLVDGLVHELESTVTP